MGPDTTRPPTSAELFLSVLTAGEIRVGIERLHRKDEPQAELLEQWLRGLHTAYRDHLIDVDADVAEEWGRLNVPDRCPVGTSPDGSMRFEALASLR